jgi:hypothetical protein
MRFFRRLFNDIVSMCFMMVGITPPEKYRNKDEEKK